MGEQTLEELLRDPAHSFLLCEESGQQAVKGMCPVHNSDACLYLYVKLTDVREAAGFTQ